MYYIFYCRTTEWHALNKHISIIRFPSISASTESFWTKCTARQDSLGGREGESQHERHCAWHTMGDPVCLWLQEENQTMGGCSLWDWHSRSQYHAAYWSLCQPAGSLVGNMGKTLGCLLTTRQSEPKILTSPMGLVCILSTSNAKVKKSPQLCAKTVLIPHNQILNPSLFHLPSKCRCPVLLQSGFTFMISNTAHMYWIHGSVLPSTLATLASSPHHDVWILENFSPSQLSVLWESSLLLLNWLDAGKKTRPGKKTMVIVQIARTWKQEETEHHCSPAFKHRKKCSTCVIAEQLQAHR